MSPRGRGILFAAGAAVLAWVLVRALLRLDAFGSFPAPYGRLLAALTLAAHRGLNAPTAVTFDFRGLDTLGEEFILFSAVTGIGLVSENAREQGGGRAPERQDRPERSGAVRGVGYLVFGAGALFGVQVAAHALLTPGGGFQGGSILASAWFLLYLALGWRVFDRLTCEAPVELAESLGAATYALTGFLSMVLGGAFLENVLPLGKQGSLFSGGSITLINAGVTIEVAAAFALVLTEMVRAALGTMTHQT